MKKLWHKKSSVTPQGDTASKYRSCDVNPGILILKSMPLITFPLLSFSFSLSEAEAFGAPPRFPLAGSALSPNCYCCWPLPVHGLLICPAVITPSGTLRSRSSFLVLMQMIREHPGQGSIHLMREQRRQEPWRRWGTYQALWMPSGQDWSSAEAGGLGESSAKGTWDSSGASKTIWQVLERLCEQVGVRGTQLVY